MLPKHKQKNTQVRLFTAWLEYLCYQMQDLQVTVPGASGIFHALEHNPFNTLPAV